MTRDIVLSWQELRGGPRLALRADGNCHFSGNARQMSLFWERATRPPRVIARIAARHEQHLASRIERGPHLRRGRVRRRRRPPQSQYRTSRGRRRGRRKFGSRREDVDDLAAERESVPRRRRRSRGHGGGGRGCDKQGGEAEESALQRAMRARGEVSVELQGVQSLSPRSSALCLQGVRWCVNLRARSSALSVQGVRRVWTLRARPSALSVQGVRRVSNLRARSYSLSVQGVQEKSLNSTATVTKVS